MPQLVPTILFQNMIKTYKKGLTEWVKPFAL